MIRNVLLQKLATRWFALIAIIFVCYIKDGSTEPTCNQSYVPITLDETTSSPSPLDVIDLSIFCPEIVINNYNVKLDGDNGQFKYTAPKLICTNPDAEARLNTTGPLVYANPWTIVATITDAEGNFTTLTLFVKLTSLNDFPATATGFRSPVIISRSTRVGAIVATCTLRDGDYPGSGHDIPYIEISSGNDDKKFAVDKRTCQVRLIDDLKENPKDTYKLDFKVFNFNDPGTTTTVEFNIIPDIKYPPKCGPFNIILGVAEDTEVNTDLKTLSCTNFDGTTNVEYFRDAQSSIPELNVTINGSIFLGANLKYSNIPANNQKRITVIAVPAGQHNLRTILTAYFRVLDVDNNIPQLTSTLFSTSISAQTLIGTSVLNLMATDDDARNTFNSKITYGFETTCTPDWLLVDGSTGAIYVKVVLDRTTATNIACKAFAYSSDKTTNTTSADVMVTITEDNRPPVITKPIYNAPIEENASNGTSVLTVSATDPDSGTNGQIEYSFPPGTTLQDWPFSISSTTGEMSVASNIDYEYKDTYLGSVIVSDKGVPPLMSTADIFVYVTPVNEYTPELQTLNNLNVDKFAKPGTYITTFTVQDKDAGPDGDVTYSLSDSSLPFVLNTQTGILSAGIGLNNGKVPFYNVTVIATDMSKTIPQKSSSKTYRVNVKTDIKNRNDPQCSPLGPISVTSKVPNIGDPVGYLTCSDLDPNTILHYEIISGNNYSLFDVTYNGSIRLRTTRIAGSYNVVFRVSDQGSPARVAIVSVQINVQTDLIITNLPRSIDIYENSNVTDVIYTVTAEGADELVTYEITNGNNLGLFIINQMTGKVTLIRTLDREVNDLHVLEISASANGRTVKNTLTMNVKDKNDNSPSFTVSFSHIKILESQPAPTPITSYQATDLDIQQNAEIDYMIISGNPGNTFGYNKSGQLLLLNKLNYKTQSFYSLVLLASDRGNPSLNTTMIVNVEVLPVSDNSLVIQSSGGRIALTLSENTPIGSAVIQIVVQNYDTNSGVTFTITSGNGGNNFTIDKTSGVVYLIYALDRETADSMIIGIKVENMNGKINNTILVINITDDNDNNPFFNPSNYVYYVPHGTTLGTSIATLTVTDRDIGVNSELTLSIISGDPNRDLKFNGKTLQAAKILDAKYQNSYDLTVLATDRGVPSLNSTAYVQLFVKPEFNKPLFNSTTFSISVAEDRIPGSLLINVDATYSGATEHTSTNPGDLVYSLSSADLSKFYIEPDIGAVQLISSFNYSLKTVFILVITASNKYNLLLNDSCTVTITVTQVNRYSPIFSLDIYVWNVDENTERGKDVGRIAATDNDSGEYGVVRFDVEPNAYFKVNSITGVFSLVTPLDYSTAKSYSLRARATDNAGVNSRTAFCLVIINVIDVNNWYPRFTNGPYEINVPENSPLGTVVLVLYAEDLDSGINGTVLYSILSGNPGAMFKLDSSTGALSISSNLDFETAQQHILIVEAKDGGSPPLSNKTIVNIKVTDQNDNSPDFGRTRIDITIRSDTAPLTSIYQCSATDRDSGTNGIVNYVIQNGNSNTLFAVDIYTGILTTAASVASAGSFQQLTMEAIDHGKPPLTGTVTIAITIQPVQSPGPATYDFSVRENSVVGTQVGTILNDPSLGVTDYIIRGGNNGNAFEMLPNGTLRTKIVADRENYAYYQLLISVNTAFTFKDVTVNVKITDVNDNAPIIVKSKLYIQIVENQPGGYVAGKFTVTDADEKGVNSEFDLYISPATPPAITYFSIDNSGKLTLTNSVSYEILSSLEFYVVARDRGTPPMSSLATVYVNVIDVNETKEYNTYEAASFTSCDFPDDAINGDVVCLLTAANVGIATAPGDTVSFTIAGRDSVFSVHPSRGYLQVSRRSFISLATLYLQWVIVSIKSGGVTTNHALMVRLDTFNKRKHLIRVKVGTNLADLQANQAALLAKLQKLFSPPKLVKIWNTVSTTLTTNRRRLLASESEALVIVETNSDTNTLSNVDKAKTFLTSEEALKVLQQSSDGKPEASLASSPAAVTSVTPYEVNDDSLDPAYIALIVVGSIFVLALIIAIIALIIYCRFYRKSKDLEKKKLVKKKNQSQQTFGNIHKSEQSEVRSRPVVNKSKLDDPDSDGMPVRPTTATFISSSKTPINASDSVPKKNSSTMLESLEEKNEDINDASVA